MTVNSNGTHTETGKRRRPRRISLLVLAILTLAATAGLAGTAGYGLRSAAGPKPCYVFNGPDGPETGTAQQSNGSLPSGDALKGAYGYEFVCTDGTWVSVSRYGN